jgi:hypothetical protein
LPGTGRPKPSRFKGKKGTQDVLKRKIEENESLFVGEYIFETFFKPIDEKSYDSGNDCDTYEENDIRRKNEHRITP